MSESEMAHMDTPGSSNDEATAGQAIATPHSPTPWTMFRERGGFTRIYGGQGPPLVVATLIGGLDGDAACGPTTDANAEFICRAVNAHDDLIAALKALADFCEAYDQGYRGDEGFPDAVRAARAVQAKAEGR